MATEGQTLEQRLEELLDQEKFSPPKEFTEQAVVTDDSIWEKAAEDREAFWAEQAEALHWETKWDKVLDEAGKPFAKWFVGGKLNVSYNCVDRQGDRGRQEVADLQLRRPARRGRLAGPRRVPLARGVRHAGGHRLRLP